MFRYDWGVDSAEHVTENLLHCVVRSFGFPLFWGRYLVRVPRISEGLTKQEIAFIRSKGIRVLPIYNAFQEAEGYLSGSTAAYEAADQARFLEIPGGVPLFANVEQFFQIDSDWILGWTEGITANGYRSGIYNDPVTGGFNEAFCNAVTEREAIRKLTILWSAQPVREPGGPGNLPDYQPSAPDCGGNVWVWQYSRNVTQCPIDTNLAERGFVNLLW